MKYILEITSTYTKEVQTLEFPTKEARWNHVKNNPIYAKMACTLREIDKED